MTLHQSHKGLFSPVTRLAVTTRLLLPLLMFVLPAAVQAQLSYSYGVTTAAVTGYAGAVPNPLNIPATITDGSNSYQVTAIADNAFAGSGVTVVNIPDSVTSIGNQAFWGCSSLTAATGGSGITSIGWYAFGYCSNLSGFTIGSNVTSIGAWAFLGCSLTSVTIPASVTSIGDYAFSDCPGLTAITVNGSNPNYANDSGDGVLFDKSKTTLIQYPQGKPATSYSIPGSVTAIGNDAFNNCSNLTAVTIPGGVTSIGTNAFASCIGLAAVTIPANVTSIGDYAFDYCPDLQSVSFATPSSLANIGNGAFQGCAALTGSLNIPGSVTTIGSGAFASCAQLTAITVDGWSTSFSSDGSGVLYDKNQTTLIAYPAGKTATSYSIPGSVTGIGDSAFQSCGNLTSVTIPGRITSIGASAFSGCASLSTVVIGNGVGSIPDYAFFDCPSLTSVTIPASVTSIGQYALNACWNVNAFFLGAPPTGDTTVFSVEPNATAYYLQSNAAQWGASYGGIATAPFYGCTFASNSSGVTITGYVGSGGEVTIPGTILIGGHSQPVTAIGDNAFAGNTALTSVGIPASVTSLGGNAFAGCTGLSAVYFDGTPPQSAAATAFAGDAATGTAYYLPDNAWAWAGTFDGLTTALLPFAYTSDGTGITLTGYYGTPPAVLSIPAIIAGLPVTTIWNSAFARTAITGVTLPDSLTTIGPDAFYDCTSLTGVSIPAHVTLIGENAFGSCTSLTSATIPGSVTSIGDYAFYQCSGLTRVVLGNGVTSIGDDAFELCSSLPSVILPASVTSLGNGSFAYCWSLSGAFFLGDAPGAGTAPDVFVGAGGFSTAYFLASNAAAWGNTYGGIPAVQLNYPYFTFTSDGANITLTGFLGTSPAVLVIPDTLNGLPVTAIAANAFSGDATLTSLTLPNSVTSIGDQAFYDCTGLTGITIGNQVTSIGSGAFAGCTGLTGVSIPSSVISIGSGAFANCGSALLSAVFQSAPPADDGTAFAGDPNLIVYDQDPAGWNSTFGGAPVEAFPYTYQDDGSGVGYIITGYTGSGGVITIPATINGEPVTGISQFAFQSNDSLTGVIIPEGVALIGDSAFAYCTSLASVTIPASVTAIGDNAFINCSALGSVSIPGNIASGTSIGNYAFYSCSTLASGTIGGGVTSIGDYAFCYCYQMSGMSIPASVISIGQGAFQSSYSLTAFAVDVANPNYSTNADGVLFNKDQTTLVSYPGGLAGSYAIPIGVTTIGGAAFAFGSLSGVTIPPGVTSIGEFAFGGTYLTSVSIPASVTSIVSDAFGECAKLTSITVDGGNPAYSSAGGVLFNKVQTTLIQYPCGLAGSYIIPTGVTSIGLGAFESGVLTDVTIPASVASIGQDAFIYCLGLKSVTFAQPSNLASIGSFAFYYCPGLTSVTIPASVTRIGDEVFYYCGALTQAEFDGNAPTMGAYVFGNNGPGFVVDYFSAATGFTSPTWDGYPSAAVGTGSNFQTWLVAKGYAADTNPLTPVAHLGGTSLLLVYALNLDPNQSYPTGPLPVAVVAAGLLSYTYYAACPDLTYQVEVSPDLSAWSSTGVTLSAPDSNGKRTASVPLASGMKFIRLAVSQ